MIQKTAAILLECDDGDHAICPRYFPETEIGAVPALNLPPLMTLPARECDCPCHQDYAPEHRKG